MSRTLLPYPQGITHMEIAAVPWALHLFQPNLPKGATIYFGIDNQAALAACKKGFSHIPYMLDQIDAMMSLATSKGWILLFHWVPTKLNVVSDTLSRDLDRSSDWKLSQHYFCAFLSFCDRNNKPRPFVDCFAASHNRQFDQYYSQHQDYGSRGNFFGATLSSKEVYWANPPFNCLNAIVPRLINMLHEASTLGWVLLPVRSMAPWWSFTSQAELSLSLDLDPKFPVFTPAIRTSNYTSSPTFTFNIYCFDFRVQ